MLVLLPQKDLLTRLLQSLHPPSENMHRLHFSCTSFSSCPGFGYLSGKRSSSSCRLVIFSANKQPCQKGCNYEQGKTSMQLIRYSSVLSCTFPEFVALFLGRTFHYNQLHSFSSGYNATLSQLPSGLRHILQAGLLSSL